MFENNIKIGDLVKIKIGDLVKSNYHVGLGIILDVILPGHDAPMIDYRYKKEPYCKKNTENLIFNKATLSF
jgi:hypothetical protein